jgi:hypothetical protein
MSPSPTARVTIWMRDFSCFSRLSAFHGFSAYFPASHRFSIRFSASQLVNLLLTLLTLLGFSCYSASHAARHLMLLGFSCYPASHTSQFLGFLTCFLCYLASHGFSELKQCAQLPRKREVSTLRMLFFRCLSLPHVNTSHNPQIPHPSPSHVNLHLSFTP